MRKLICLSALLIGLFSTPAITFAQNYEILFRGFQADGLTQADKRFLQTALAFEGHYNGLLDGDWGLLSQRALERYAWQEFGTGAEDWHLAALAFGFFEISEQDGWRVRHFGGLDMSMLYPYRAAIDEPPTENFINWRHANSSLSYSVGIHSRATVQRIHSYTAGTHSSSAELYTLRRRNVTITSATKNNGGVLYARSNFSNGTWHTVLLSANRRDVSILNAVAASISVGRAPSISVTENGKLEKVILQTAAMVSQEGGARQANTEVSPAPDSSNPQTSTGTGFIVHSDGYILTNAHLVDGCQSVMFDGLATEVIAESSEFDLALLRADNWEGVGVAMFSPIPARLNSDVTVVGYPLAGFLSGLNITRGAVSSQMGFGGDVGRMQISAPIQPGSSGGPVIAADGEVVGVVVSKLDAEVVAEITGDIPQNVNFAIRGALAKLFLFQHGVEPILGTSDDTLSPVALAELASGFTGFIECK